MKNNVSIFCLICLLFVLFCFAAFAGDTPKCSDPTVKNTIFQIFKNEMGSQFFMEVAMAALPKNPNSNSQTKHVPITNAQAFKSIGTEEAQTTNMMGLIVLGSTTQEEFRAKYKNDARISTLLNSMDMRISDLMFTLSGTRMDKLEEKIQKCTCSGELTLDGVNRVTRTVRYSAQYTDDGRVYVQLLGVR